LNIQESVPKVGTSRGPAFHVHDGKPYLAWKGEGSDPGIYWSVASTLTPGSNSEYSWSAQSKIAGIGTSNGPAITGFNGKLYLAFKGESDDSLNIASYDGTNWSAGTKLAGSSSNGPALTTTSKLMMMVWKDPSDGSVAYSTSTNGTDWTPQQYTSAGATSDTPALTAVGDDVHMAWKAGTGDNRLFWAKYDGSSWSNQQRSAGSSWAPAVTSCRRSCRVRC
jgi:hypothetical protein